MKLVPPRAFAVAAFISLGVVGALASEPVPLSSYLERLSPESRDAIERAAALNPGILSGAVRNVERRADADTLLSDHPPPDLLQQFEADLLRRAGLTALGNRQIEIDPGMRISPEELLRMARGVDLPDLPGLQLPGSDALEALRNNQFVIRHLCRPGEHDDLLRGIFRRCIKEIYDPYLFKAVVLLTVDGKPNCTGTLIDNRTIVTAAHCLLGTTWLLGSGKMQFRLSGDQKLRPILAAKPLAQFASDPDGYKYDVAIVAVDPAEVPSGITFARLRLARTSGKVPVTFAGYGANDLDPRYADQLLIGRQSIELTPHAGDTRVSWLFTAGDDFVSNFCKGDSGGPVFLYSPRNRPDELELVATISSYKPQAGDVPLPAPHATRCTSAAATIVNMSAENLATEICALIGHPSGDCTGAQVARESSRA